MPHAAATTASHRPAAAQKNKGGWSPERRAAHAAAIRRWKPWEKSTGPRSRAGKAKSAQNAYKHGGYALQLRLLHQALAAQRACVRAALVHRRAHKENPRNELLPRLLCHVLRLDRIFRVRLRQAFHPPDYAKILLFPGDWSKKLTRNPTAIGPATHRGG